MKTMARRILLDHPNSVGESYLEHLLFAMRFSGGLFIAAFAAFVHALIPCLCEKTASKKISELHDRMHNR